MAYTVVPESGEQVEAEIELNFANQPFSFAVSNQAIYIPRIKLIAKTDPYYFQRVPLHKLQQVTVRRVRPYALWALAGLMISVGFVTTLFMMEPLLRNEAGTYRVSGWPIAVFVCGFLVPFAAKGRFGLEIQFTDGRYRWKPPLVVDKASKQKVTDSLETIVEALKKVGVRIADDRTR